MSEQNLELLRKTYEFVQREHEPDFDRLDPDIQWHTRADLPDTTTYHGHAGAKTLMDEWWAAFDDLSVDVEELIDAGDRVVAVMRLHGRVKGSTHEVDMSETHVVRIRDGRVTEIHEYPTKDEALKVVGLAE